ncbi:beta-galactosidase [Coraliomargarita sp. W4R53]
MELIIMIKSRCLFMFVLMWATIEALAAEVPQSWRTIASDLDVRYSSTSAFAPEQDTLLTTMAGDMSFHTAAEKAPWLIIDLKEKQPVAGVEIFNRSGRQGMRTRNLHVWLSTDQRNWTQVFAASAPQQRWLVAFDKLREVRYIKIGMINNHPEFFHLKGVKIYTQQGEINEAPIKEAKHETLIFDVSNIPVPDHHAPELAAWTSTNPEGVTLSSDKTTLLRDGKPLPLAMGEFHPQRYPEDYWEEVVLEMKAGGLNAISCYWFWTFIEPRPDVFNFDGNNDIRRFVELCQKHDMLVFLRIGPFCNAEILNGGLPSWLFGMPFAERSNDPGYLERVGLYFQKMGQQIQGQLWKDGGPIFMVQVENELGVAPINWSMIYRHGAAEEHRGPVDPAAFVEHYQSLRELALQAGFNVPFFTMTAWGGSRTTLPEKNFIYAYGGYMYLGKPGENNSTLTCLMSNYQVSSPYPLQYIELGAAGSPARMGWVPQPPVESAISTVFSRIGASSSLAFGWYMYQGGTSPLHSDWGWSTKGDNLGLMSYDYHAPLSEYGLPRPAYYDLRPFHQTMLNFADSFTYGGVVYQDPEVGPREDKVRASVRLNNEGGGAVFLLHYGNVNALNDRTTHLELKTKTGNVRIPSSGELDLVNGDCIMLPFNLDLEHDIRLISSTAQLSGHVVNQNETVYFVSTLRDQAAELVFELPAGVSVKTRGQTRKDGSLTLVSIEPSMDATVDLIASDGSRLIFSVIPAQMIRRSVEAIVNGQKMYLISEQDLVADGNRVRLTSLDSNEFSLLSYPSVDWQGGHSAGKVGIFERITATVPTREVQGELMRTHTQKMLMKLDEREFDGLNDIYATVDFEGLICRIFDLESGLPVGDQLWGDGFTWRVGLKRFKSELSGKGLLFRANGVDGTVHQSVSDGILLEEERTGNGFGVLNGITFHPEYTVELNASN